MSLVSLELFKKHVRSDDFEGEDEYLGYLLEAAESWVVRETSRSVEELYELGNGEFPLPLRHAIMMIAGHWYNQREAVSGVQMSEVPYSLQALIKPWTKLAE